MKATVRENTVRILNWHLGVVHLETVEGDRYNIYTEECGCDPDALSLAHEVGEAITGVNWGYKSALRETAVVIGADPDASPFKLRSVILDALRAKPVDSEHKLAIATIATMLGVEPTPKVVVDRLEVLLNKVRQASHILGVLP
jgi:hypothetical protein